MELCMNGSQAFLGNSPEYLDNRDVMRYNTETAGVDCFYFPEK